jgi:hypothetical protein
VELFIAATLREFHRAGRLREAQGSPQGPGARAVSFGSFSFPEKKMNTHEKSAQNSQKSIGTGRGTITSE